MRVFVASSSRDAPWLAWLDQALTDSGNLTWVMLHVREPDPNWQRQAIEAIRGADAFLFVTSSRSVVSIHCLWELETALTQRKPCFQWIIEPVAYHHAAESLPVIASGKTEEVSRWAFGPGDVRND